MARLDEYLLIITGGKSWKSVSNIDKFREIANRRSARRVEITTDVPELDFLSSVADSLRGSSIESVVAIGGGKIIDSAKVVAGLISLPDEEPLAVVRQGLVGGKVPEIIAMPTTAGSGSEATSFAVVYKGNRKYSYNNIKIRPSEVVFSEEAVSRQPRQVMVSSSLDATCQAIESIWSNSSSEESLKFAQISLKELWPIMKNGLKGEIDYKLLIKCANNSGEAINLSKTTGAHALSYGLTRIFGIPHGIAVSLMMGSFLDFHSDLEIMGILNEALGGPASQEWRKMLRSITTGLIFPDHNKLRNRIPELSSMVNKQRLANNPKKITNIDVESLFEGMIEDVRSLSKSS